MRNKVLIISPDDDTHVKSVRKELINFGSKAFQFDLKDFPAKNEFSISYNANESIWINGEEFNEENTVGVWLRRISSPSVSENIKQTDARNFAIRSINDTFFGGMSFFSNRVMNPVGSSHQAQLKPFQLQLAKKAGLKIPRTLITSNKNSLAEFIEENTQIIYKPIVTWHYGLKETRILSDGDLEDIDSIEHCPTIFQEYIDGDIDLRITIVGSEIFCGAQEISKGRSKIDGRLDRVPIFDYKLDDSFRKILLNLHAEFGLVYGAYDFRLSSDGPVFLEVNPAGQFLFVEIRSGLKISNAIARWLSHKF